MQNQGVVIDSVANLYSQPSMDVDLVTQATVGTSLSILDSQDGWYDVRLPDQYQGWIEARHVRVYAEDEAPYASAGQVAQVDNLFAFLYRTPEVTSHVPTRRVTLGTRLAIAAQQGGWLQVALPDGSLHWVHKGAVILSTAGEQRERRSVEEVIRTAKRCLGLPYLWGGSTPLGLDCSGYVQLVYRLNGVSLLRDANIQFTQPDLAPVAKEELQAGDLIFFGETRITHVGMYIGQGQFIHATTHLRPVVQISRLDEVHWTERYQGARRP
jgi:cell wall-associated NlpC family hydrolase